MSHASQCEGPGSLGQVRQVWLRLAPLVLFGHAATAEFEIGRVIALGSDPYACMGYSFVLVGGSGMRAVLAGPLLDTLHLAGEATHTTRAATVRGAIGSGSWTAGEIIGCSEGGA